jgi:hypothetical protein
VPARRVLQWSNTASYAAPSTFSGNITVLFANSFNGVAGLILLLSACGGEERIQGGDNLPDTTTTGTPSTPASYQRVAGDEWTYTSQAGLRATNYFWWFDSRDVYSFVQLVPDATFGQVARITQPVNTGEPGPSPRLMAKFTPMNKMWFRWRMKFSPGWTTVGPTPPAANSYKVAFWTFATHDGRGAVELTNTDQYLPEFGALDRSTGQYVNYTETPLPGSKANWGSVSSDASVYGSNAWQDGQWWEFVVYYDKTGPASARQLFWRRRLTANGIKQNNTWMFIGWTMTGGTTPQVHQVELGANKNRSTPVEQYIYWGPWEVVDGEKYNNPFGMPNV